MKIKNERQYKFALSALAASEAGITEVRAQAGELAAPTGVAYIAAYVDGLEELREQIGEYEAVRDGQAMIEINDISDLPIALIKHRIRRGWTQRRLADEIGAHEQQVQRWEENEYYGVRFETIERVAHALKIPLYATASPA